MSYCIKTDEAFIQDGSKEHEVWDHLKQLPEDWYCFYQPSIEGANGFAFEPDFILFGSKGCIVLETKNWANFKSDGRGGLDLLDVNGSVKGHAKNPLSQVRQHQFALMEHLRRCAPDNLLNPTGVHRGKPCFPIYHALAFIHPAWSGRQLEIAQNLGLHRADMILTWEDFASPEAFEQKLEQIPRPFDIPKSLRGEHRLRAQSFFHSLFPQLDFGKVTGTDAIQKQKLSVGSDIAEFSANLTKLINELESAENHLNTLNKGRPRNLKGLTETIERLKKDKDKGLKVAVFGGFCSGKSSLINALLGIECLEVGVQVTTATLTIIRQARNGNEFATVSYKSALMLAMEFWEQAKEDYKAVCNPHNQEQVAHLQEFDTAFASLAHLFKREPDELANINDHELANSILPALHHYLNFEVDKVLIAPEIQAEWQMRRDHLKRVSNISDDILECLGTEHELRTHDLGSVLAQEQRALAIEHVTLHIDSPFLEGDVQIIDTPGLGSLFQRHTRLSESYVRDADVVIYVLPAKGLGKDDIQFLSMMRRRSDVLDEDKVFFAANMIDQVVDEDCQYGPQEQVIEAIQRHQISIGETLARQGFTFGRVFPISAECARWSVLAQSIELDRKQWRRYEKHALWFDSNESPVPEVNLELSGLPEMTRSIKNYLSCNEILIRTEQVQKRVGGIASLIANECEERRTLMQEKEDTLETEFAHWQEKREAIVSNHNSKVESTKDEIAGKVDRYGLNPTLEVYTALLNDLTNEIADSWLQEKHKGLTADAMSHIGTLFLNLFRGGNNAVTSFLGDEEKSSTLQIRIETLIKSAVDKTLEKQKTLEKVELINKDLSKVVTEKMQKSLASIARDLGEYQAHSRLGTNFRTIKKNPLHAYQDTLVEDNVNIFTATLLGALGVAAVGAGAGGGLTATAADALITGGAISLATALAAILVPTFYDWFKKLKNGKVSYDREVKGDIKKLMEKKIPRLIEKTVKEPYSTYKKDLIQQYNDRVEALLNEIDDSIEQAKADLTLTHTERESLELDLKQTESIMESLMKSMHDLLPLPSAALDNQHKAIRDSPVSSEPKAEKSMSPEPLHGGL
jgi:GTPase SAR1 family protein